MSYPSHYNSYQEFISINKCLLNLKQGDMFVAGGAQFKVKSMQLIYSNRHTQNIPIITLDGTRLGVWHCDIGPKIIKIIKKKVEV